MCEPSFFHRLNSGWAELKEQNAEKIEVLNDQLLGDTNVFKLDLVSFSTHINGYLDRYIDIRSRNALRADDGSNYRYTCRYPYKNFVQQTSHFVVRVETDLKLNLTLKSNGQGGEGATETTTKLIQDSDIEQIKQNEVHFIMFEGLINQHEMGLIGFLKMLWRSKKLEILPQDGRWQISDFDHFMRGNPHDVIGMKAAFGQIPQPPPLEEEEKK